MKTREQMLEEALRAVWDEVCPDRTPYSAESYLPTPVLEKVVRALATPPDDVARDAARYRWLRAQFEVGSVRTLLPLYRSLYWVGSVPCDDVALADAAIDAAMREGE